MLLMGFLLLGLEQDKINAFFGNPLTCRRILAIYMCHFTY